MISVPFLAFLFVPAAAEANQPPPKPELKATVITLRPAAEPNPALKYRFTISRVERTQGNAAIYYHRAIQMLLSKRNTEIATAKPAPGKPAPEPSETKAYNWLNGPIKDIPLAEAKGLLASYQNVLREVELGSMCKGCDWEFDPRTEAFELLLPEIQETRAISRLVVLKAKIAILEKNIDEAMHWIEVGLTLAQHTGDGPIIIQALVGIAETGDNPQGDRRPDPGRGLSLALLGFRGPRPPVHRYVRRDGGGTAHPRQGVAELEGARLGSVVHGPSPQIHRRAPGKARGPQRNPHAREHIDIGQAAALRHDRPAGDGRAHLQDLSPGQGSAHRRGQGQGDGRGDAHRAGCDALYRARLLSRA